jgi:hypothetical protein
LVRRVVDVAGTGVVTMTGHYSGEPRLRSTSQYESLTIVRFV